MGAWRRAGGIGLLLSLGLVPGCVTPPAKRDPFADLNIAAPIDAAERTYPNTTLALLHSKNTDATRDYLRNFAGSVGALFRHNYWPAAKFDADQLFARISGVLERHFSSVRKIGDISDAAPSGAKLVAVIDVTAKIAPPPVSRTTTFEATIRARAFPSGRSTASSTHFPRARSWLPWMPASQGRGDAR